ncbi:LOW QUALITY PROTEIN: BTB/POZ domain-containing protein KCTD19 [Chlamydotis macqueenii]
MRANMMMLMRRATVVLFLAAVWTDQAACCPVTLHLPCLLLAAVYEHQKKHTSSSSVCRYPELLSNGKSWITYGESLLIRGDTQIFLYVLNFLRLGKLFLPAEFSTQALPKDTGLLTFAFSQEEIFYIRECDFFLTDVILEAVRWKDPKEITAKVRTLVNSLGSLNSPES